MVGQTGAHWHMGYFGTMQIFLVHLVKRFLISLVKDANNENFLQLKVRLDWFAVS